VECPRPTKYSVSFAYDETVGTLLFLGKSVQSGASIPLASLTNLSLTYQAKELVGNKVKVTVTNDAPKAVSKEATWTVNADDTYSVETSQEGEGELVVRGAKNLQRVPAGTELTVFATPADGWELVALTANDVDILKSKTFEVAGNTTVRATFTKKAPTTYAVTLTKEGEGKVAISGADNLGAVVAGTKLTVTATPADGWDLVALTANGADILSSKTFVVYNPTEVRATFTKKAPTTYAVTLTKEGEGKVVITGADNLGAVRAGTKLTVTATPATGWGVKSITANGKDITAEKSFVVTSNTIVKVVFAIKTYPVTLTKEGDGRAFILETDNLGAVALGSKLTVIAEPYPGWDVKSITANGKDITTDKTFVVNGATDVNVVFYKVLESRVVVRYDPTEIAEMSLNDLPPLMTSDGPGLHTISVRMGDDVKLSIKAKDGYRITFVASDPSGLLRPTRRTSSEAEYLINTSKHQEVEVLVHCTRQS
ncbi:InlB B-repeat-containing protein, partial [Porphyromonas uenonis]|uniref:InlB B-repeat-containing protein n=1 Tax=Porphyromonas uenonis TaxID=281920 RepID=UPI0039793B60